MLTHTKLIVKITHMTFIFLVFNSTSSVGVGIDNVEIKSIEGPFKIEPYVYQLRYRFFITSLMKLNGKEYHVASTINSIDNTPQGLGTHGITTIYDKNNIKFEEKLSNHEYLSIYRKIEVAVGKSQI